MTDTTSDAVANLEAGFKPATIAAYRYLAFLDLERRWLVHETKQFVIVTRSRLRR